MVESLRELTIPQTESLMKLAQAALRTARVRRCEARRAFEASHLAVEVFDTRVGQCQAALVEKAKRGG